MVLPVMQYTDPILSTPLVTPEISPVSQGVARGVGLASQLQQMVERQKLLPGQLEAQTMQNRLRAAQAGLAGAQTKFMPLKLALTAQQQQRQATRFGQAYQLSRMIMAMPQADRAAWIAANPNT
jgi:hypothetical protein